MRVVAKAADRLLGLVVPGITAGACCSFSGRHFQQECSCTGGTVWIRNCTVTCTCGSSCGACFDSKISC